MVTRIGPKNPTRHFLKKWRLAKNLTQEKLAARMGTSKGQISNYENHKRDLSFKAQSALSEALARMNQLGTNGFQKHNLRAIVSLGIYLVLMLLATQQSDQAST